MRKKVDIVHDRCTPNRVGNHLFEVITGPTVLVTSRSIEVIHIQPNVEIRRFTMNDIRIHHRNSQNFPPLA